MSGPPSPSRAAPGAVREVLVLGGGLAGIAAAVRLSEAGVRVTLIEARDRLGGRASSFRDAATGEWIDACQHVVLRCCTSYLDLLARLGTLDRLDWWPALELADKHGNRDRLTAGALPAPWHLGSSLLHFRGLLGREKWALVRGMSQVLRIGPRGRHRYDGETFAHWLAARHQPRAAIERFWSVVAVSALNESIERASAAHALQVFQQGLLASRDAWQLGIPSVPLVNLYRSTPELLARAGGEVLLSTPVRRLCYEGGRITGVELADGRVRSADAYVSALPFAQLARLVPPALLEEDARLAHLSELEHSPILGIHLWYRPAVTSASHLIFTDSPLQWMFNKGLKPATGEQHLVLVISAAHDWIDRGQTELVAMATHELSHYVGAAAKTRPRSQIIKERQATFSPRPGVDRLRPSAVGATANLLLAGDWCKTGWPATMEGAVQSGYLAAGAITGASLLAPPAPVTKLIEWLPAWRHEPR